jgi:hypothetical protein
MDPDPDPSINLLLPSKNSKKTLDSYCFVPVTSFRLFILKNDANVPSKNKKNIRKTFF